jgi:hypothetical protein
MWTQEIPRDVWVSFCESFSRLHRGWPATVEVLEDGVIRTVVRDMALADVEADLRGDREETVQVSAGEPPYHLTHRIAKPRRLLLQLNAEGVHQGLRVDADGGMTTLVRFRVSAAPETVEEPAADILPLPAGAF